MAPDVVATGNEILAATPALYDPLRGVLDGYGAAASDAPAKPGSKTSKAL
jgi:hypothetical protein